MSNISEIEDSLSEHDSHWALNKLKEGKYISKGMRSWVYKDGVLMTRWLYQIREGSNIGKDFSWTVSTSNGGEDQFVISLSVSNTGSYFQVFNTEEELDQNRRY